jgi:hypothetical protein
MRKRVAVCVICDGGSFEELLSDQFVRIALEGCVMVAVDSTPEWAYTIGLAHSFDHPELVVTGLPSASANHVLAAVVDRVREGERFTASSPRLSLCECTTATFGMVHPGQWDSGRFAHWVRYYDWVGDEPPRREALQVLWDKDGRYPPDPDFCPVHGTSCQPLLDGAPRHNVNTGSNREQRRRAKYGHGKRRRR